MTDQPEYSVEVECVYDNGCGKPEGECAVTCKAVLDAVANTIGKGTTTAHPRVQGRCPACNGSSLFLGSDGHVTCARLDCPNPCAADDQLHRGRPDDTTTRVFAALHQSAEQDVTRVINLYEQWVKAGPPPLGTSIVRWWDKRLIELHEAIRPAADEPARTTPNNDGGPCPACRRADQAGLAPDEQHPGCRTPASKEQP